MSITCCKLGWFCPSFFPGQCRASKRRDWCMRTRRGTGTPGFGAQAGLLAAMSPSPTTPDRRVLRSNDRKNVFVSDRYSICAEWVSPLSNTTGSAKRPRPAENARVKQKNAFTRRMREALARCLLNRHERSSNKANVRPVQGAMYFRRHHCSYC